MTDKRCRYCTKCRPITKPEQKRDQLGNLYLATRLQDQWGEYVYNHCEDTGDEWYNIDFERNDCERYVARPITAADLDFWESYIQKRWAEFTGLRWVTFEVSRSEDALHIRYKMGSRDEAWTFKVGEPAAPYYDFFNLLNTDAYNYRRAEQLAKDPDPVFRDNRPDCEIDADGYSSYSRKHWRGGVGW